MWENSIFCHCHSHDANYINLSHPKHDYDVLFYLILMWSNLLFFKWSRVIPLSSTRQLLYASYWTNVDCFLLHMAVGITVEAWAAVSYMSYLVSSFFLLVLTCKEIPSVFRIVIFLSLIVCWSLLLFPIACQFIMWPLCYQTFHAASCGLKGQAA